MMGRTVRHDMNIIGNGKENGQVTLNICIGFSIAAAR